MFKKRTVFIVGAGASAEFDLPVGDALKQQIAELLLGAAGSVNSPQISGFRAMLSRMCPQDHNELLQAGRQLGAPIKSFVSIDEALHYFSSDPLIVRIGKMAIAFLILKAERESKIAKTDRSTGLPDLSHAQKTWLAEFLSMALSFLKRDEIENAFANVQFINFNYDRVVEQFLWSALYVQAGLPEERARDVAASLRIIHPYGFLGKLNWQDRRGVMFGGDGYTENIPQIAELILTYTEQVDHEKVRHEIGQALDDAELVIFVGFGFHQQNMALLKTKPRKRQVYATAYRIDKDNHEIFMSGLAEHANSTVRFFDRTGYDLLSALRPSIMSAAS